jgi:hypothetical protein
MLDADFARDQRRLGLLELRQLAGQLDLPVGAATRHVAVVPQPAGRGVVARLGEELLAVEGRDPARPLGGEAVSESSDLFNPVPDLERREHGQIDGTQRAERALQTVKHLFDCTTAWLAGP